MTGAAALELQAQLEQHERKVERLQRIRAATTASDDQQTVNRPQFGYRAGVLRFGRWLLSSQRRPAA